MNATTDLRPSPIAGQWYPDDPKKLAASVDGYLARAELPPLSGEVVAIIAPHAGHLYSGPVAGYAFAAVRSLAPDLVAIIAPMHYPMPYPLITSAHDAYQTPLGEIPVAHEVIEKLDQDLQSELGYGLTRVRHDHEHALEIELPFLQRAVSPGYELLPIMLREVAPQPLRILGTILARHLEKRQALLVASSDLSHYYPQEAAQRLDREMLKRIEAFDPRGVLHAEEEGAGFACGRGAIAAVLWAAQALGATAVQLLHYATSGEVSGDFNQVVGYGAAAVLRQRFA